MAELGMDRALRLSCSLTGVVVAPAQFACDVVRSEVAEVRQDRFAGIGHGLGRGLVTQVGPVEFPYLCDGMGAFPVGLPAEDIYGLCFRFRSGGCLKLMAPTFSVSRIAPVGAEASSESSNADVCCHVSS